MNKLICIITLLVVTSSHSAGTVDFLKIDKDIVLFSTTEVKTDASPTCVNAGNADKWAVSLKSESGRAIYSLLVTAMAKDLGLDVESANDCADAEGLERASGVNMIPVVSDEDTGKVKWAGYTNSILPHFGAGNDSSAFTGGSKICNTKYPGSRLMMWDDYVQIINEYPATSDIWFIDAVEAVSNAFSNNYQDQRQQNELLIFKNGGSFYRVAESKYANYSSAKHAYAYSCNNWTSANSGYGGLMMYKEGKIISRSCDNYYPLACVK
jgi:hypothetical protein